MKKQEESGFSVLLRGQTSANAGKLPSSYGFLGAIAPESPLPTQQKPPLPASLGEVGRALASSGRGKASGRGTASNWLQGASCRAQAPSRMSLKAPFDLPQLRWER